MDVFVDPAVMQQTMEEVVPGVFNDGAAEALSEHQRPGGDEERRQEEISYLRSHNNSNIADGKTEAVINSSCEEFMASVELFYVQVKIHNLKIHYRVCEKLRVPLFGLAKCI